MKRFIIAVILLFSTLFSFAQYKKAGALYGREGISRTYGFGVTTVTSKYYPSPAIGFVLSGGGEREDSKWFSNSSIRVTMPTNFALKTIATSYSGPQYDVVLKAKVTVSAGVDYEFGRYFGKIEENEKKFIPYAIGGVGFMLGRFKEGSSNRQAILDQTGADRIYGELDEEFATGGTVHGGIGAIYFLNEKIGIRAQATYNYSINFENLIHGNEDEYKVYSPFNSGLLFQVRLHFKLPY